MSEQTQRLDDSELASALNGVAAIVAGVYLAFVVYRGNVKPLGSALYQDGIGWLEFLIAVYALAFLYNTKRYGEVVGGFIGLAAVALLFRLITSTDTSAFSDFANGRLGLFAFIGKLAGVN